MDAVERLTLEAISAHSLIAIEHIHRYELAAELCAGLKVLDLGCGTGYGSGILAAACRRVVGVDNDVATVDTAQATVGRETGADFEVGDAHEVLARPLADEFDAIVLFETLEHLARPDEAIAALRARAEEGLKLLVSVPNDKALRAENPYHVSTYGYEDAVELAAGFGDGALLFQFLAEGSIVRGEDADDSAGRLVAVERGEPEYANHFLVCINFGDSEALRQATSRMHVEAAPLHNRYVLNLERANAELRRTNARLTRRRLGTADSAAASLLAQLETARAELERVLQERREREEAEAERRRRLEELEQVVAARDETIAFMQSTKAWRLGAAWWRVRDRVLRRG